MKVRVTYKSGKTQLFIVAGSMRVVDFQKLAEPLGGRIYRLKFL
jgi:hypothetical protein